MYVSIGLHRLLKNIIELLLRAVAKTVTEVKCLCFILEKRHCFCVCFSPSCFVCMRRNQQGNLAFRTTGVEDPNLTLAAISFYIGTNHSLYFLLLQLYKKKIADFSFL